MNKICFECIDSTNKYLKDNYVNLDNELFVRANTQTQGKGRTNRNWDSEDNKNLLFSLLLKDKKYFKYYASISILTAYSIIEVLSEYSISDLSIKWPNDIYVKDKKICGILLEAISTNEMECLIVGVGVNVNQTEFKSEYINKPTSIKKILNKDIDLDELEDKIYSKLINNLYRLIDGYDYYLEISKYDYLKDKEVYALIDDLEKLVKVIGIDKDYSLKVVVENKETNITSGEISFHVIGGCKWVSYMKIYYYLLGNK